MKKQKFTRTYNGLYKKNQSYLNVRLTLTSRVVAGWAITLVGLIKLWQTEDPAAWWPILMGGTGLMIVSRGVDHFMKNKGEEIEDEHKETIMSIEKNAYKHASLDEEYVNPLIQKHEEYQKRLNV